MALSRPIGWLRDQRGDAVGLATADPLFQGGETKPTGYVATYSPVFTAEQVQQAIKEASMALSNRDCRHGRHKPKHPAALPRGGAALGHVQPGG